MNPDLGCVKIDGIGYFDIFYSPYHFFPIGGRDVNIIPGGHKILNRVHPTFLLLLSFLAAIGLGAALLMLPVSTVNRDIGFIDALFTATSAVCVTGLTVVDTGGYFSVFGQCVILFLIQIGGLGIMTISVALFQIIGKKVVFQQRMAMQEVFSHTPRADIYSLIWTVFKFTIMIELAGALVLFLYWGRHSSLPDAAFNAMFHSISAFCNAGFSLFETSLMQENGSFTVNVAVVLLIILGGIGFPVVYEVYERFRKAKKGRFSLQSKVVMTTSAILILAGALVILAAERELIAQMGFWRSLMSAVFQSVTCRTAGFNTLDIASLNTAVLLFMMFLMLVGASPGSCGGGIKTTTLAVLAAFSWSRLWRYKCVNLFRKTIPQETVSKSVTILVLSLVTICIAVFLILLIDPEHGTRAGGSRQFLCYLFETVSAFATVGLSMGVTPNLTLSGKMIIIMLMIIGRVGVPAFTYIIAGAGSVRGIQYAEENMMIG
jgi:trk system potassium uptake protein TrkH